MLAKAKWEPAPGDPVLVLPNGAQGGLRIHAFDGESIWIQSEDGEGMQLRLTNDWWKRNF